MKKEPKKTDSPQNIIDKPKISVSTGEMFYHSEMNMEYHEVLLNDSLIGLLYRTLGEQLWILSPEDDLKEPLGKQLTKLATTGQWTTAKEAEQSIAECTQRIT